VFSSFVLWLMIRTVCTMGRHLSTEKKKTLPELTRRAPIIEVHKHAVDLEKKVWGGTTVYPRLFGVNISSMFLLRTTNKIGDLWLIRLDSTTPTIGESCTLARSQQACSVTHRKDYKPFQETLQTRNSIRTPTEDKG
jgi:hypothetical protein